MFLVVLIAAAQLQPMRLPPVPPAPIEKESLLPMGVNLPDLAFGGIRVLRADIVEFEVKNQGRVRTPQQVPLVACVYGPSRNYCSASHTVGVLGAGESRWVRVNCFYRLPDFRYDGPPICDLPSDYVEQITKYTVRIDTFGSATDEFLNRNRRMAPVSLEADCTAEYGCVREMNETNNRAEFEGPFTNSGG